LILTIQAGIVLGLLGIKGLMLIVNKVAQKVGEGIELSKSELKSLVNDIISDIKKADKGNSSFAELERELKKRIDSGEITKAKDIIPVIKEFTK
jgi:DNA-binding transcriptional regulator GbsR (MarR family)